MFTWVANQKHIPVHKCNLLAQEWNGLYVAAQILAEMAVIKISRSLGLSEQQWQLRPHKTATPKELSTHRGTDLIKSAIVSNAARKNLYPMCQRLICSLNTSYSIFSQHFICSLKSSSKPAKSCIKPFLFNPAVKRYTFPLLKHIFFTELSDSFVASSKVGITFKWLCSITDITLA